MRNLLREIWRRVFGLPRLRACVYCWRREAITETYDGYMWSVCCCECYTGSKSANEPSRWGSSREAAREAWNEHMIELASWRRYGRRQQKRGE